MDVLTPFEGDWHLSRVIEDHAARATLRLDGQARLIRDGQGLTYEETGRWTEGPHAGLLASRRYLWRADGAGIAVLFEDGRPFHRFDPAQDGAECVHECPPDLYVGTYGLDLPESWAVVWQVTGPRKDYRSRSVYRRG